MWNTLGKGFLHTEFVVRERAQWWVCFGYWCPESPGMLTYFFGCSVIYLLFHFLCGMLISSFLYLAYWPLFWGPVFHCRILQILNLHCRKRLQGSIVIQMISNINCSSLTVHLHWRAPKIRHLFINSSACWIPMKHSFVSSHHFDSAYKYVTCSYVEVSCATMSSWGVHNLYRFVSCKFRPVVGCSSATWLAEERCSVWQGMGACWPAHTAFVFPPQNCTLRRKWSENSQWIIYLIITDIYFLCLKTTWNFWNKPEQRNGCIP